MSYSALFGAINAPPITTGGVFGTLLLSALSLGLGSLWCSPTVAFLGGMTATRMITSGQSYINSVLWWISIVFGVGSAFVWNRMGSLGLKIVAIITASVAAIGAYATTIAYTPSGGNKMLSCKKSSVCRAGPREHGVALNEGQCFDACCDKTRDVAIVTKSHKDAPFAPGKMGTIQRLRVQWPNGVKLHLSDWGGMYHDTSYEWATAEPYDKNDKNSVQIDFGGGCKSEEGLTGEFLNVSSDTYYDGEFGVSVDSKLNSGAPKHGFYYNKTTADFLTRKCGLGQVSGKTRLFAQESSRTSQAQCDGVPCTGIDPLKDMNIAPYDSSLPTTSSNTEFYINPEYGGGGYCCPGYEKTDYGTCKRMVDTIKPTETGDPQPHPGDYVITYE